MSQKIRVLVTAVGAPPGRNVVKALSGKKDIEVVAAESDPLTPVLYNRRETYKSFLLPKATDETAYVRKILEVAKQEKIKVVLPCIEDEILLLSKKKSSLSKKGLVVVCPHYDRLRLLLDKMSMVQIAKKANIPVPDTVSLKRFLSKPSLLPGPVIIKPRIGYGSRNVVIPKTRKDINTFVRQFEGNAGDYIVQKYIPGGTGSIFMCGLLYGRNRQPRMTFLSRSIKTLFDFGGPALSGEPVRGFNRVKEYSKKLVKEAGGWYGPAGIEYKVSSSDGIPYLLEVNPRFWGYALLAAKSGMNFPYLAVMDAVGRKVTYPQEYRDDIVLLRETQDTVILRSQLTSTLERKVICVYILNDEVKQLAKNVKKLSLLRNVDKIVVTGNRDILERINKNNCSDALSVYTQQGTSRDENLYEIGLYYFADILVIVKDSQKSLNIVKIQEAIDNFSGSTPKRTRIKLNDISVIQFATFRSTWKKND